MNQQSQNRASLNSYKMHKIIKTSKDIEYTNKQY